MKKILQLILSLSFFSSFAQSEFTLGMMEHVYQSSYINMTAKPDHKVSVGLPGMSSIYAAFGFSAFSTNDTYRVVGKDQQGKDVTNWFSQNIREKLNNNSLIYTSAAVDLFHLRIKARNTFISFHVRSVYTGFTGLPSSLGDVITGNNVNTDNSPKNWNLSGLSLDQTHYNEYAFGISTTLKKFSYGFRVKFLQGLSNISTENDNAGLNFNSMFQAQGSGSIRANISAPIDQNDKTIPEYSSANNNSTGDIVNKYFTNFDNKGFATDLALGYQLNQKLSFGLSVNDIGFISWSSNGSFREINANVSFTGVTSLDTLFKGGGVGDLKLALTDVTIPRGAVESYTKFLIPNMYFTTKYEITPRWKISGTVFVQKYHSVRVGVAAGTQLKLGNLFSVAGNINYQYSSLTLGFGFVFKPGPFQIYLATDHIPLTIEKFQNSDGSTAAYVPRNTNQFNFRFGINLVFGKERVPQAQPISY